MTSTWSLPVLVCSTIRTASALGVATKKDKPDHPEHPEHPVHPEYSPHPHDADGIDDSRDVGEDEDSGSVPDQEDDSVSPGVGVEGYTANTNYAAADIPTDHITAPINEDAETEGIGSVGGGYSVPISSSLTSEAPQFSSP